MASHLQENALTFRAGGTIVKGHAVKIGTDAQHVIECTATTDKAIGLAMNDAVLGQAVEVAMPGGGAKAKLQGTVNAGALLTSHTDGTIKKVAAANDRLVAMALADGVAGDLCPVQVISGQGTATES